MNQMIVETTFYLFIVLIMLVYGACYEGIQTFILVPLLKSTIAGLLTVLTTMHPFIFIINFLKFISNELRYLS